jgi:hypothetical protein
MTTVLDDADRALRDGAEGPAMQLAMRLVLRAAQIMRAPSLIPVSFAHIDACFYAGQASAASGRCAPTSASRRPSARGPRWRRRRGS